MATVNAVSAQIAGQTVTFAIPQSSAFLDGRDVSGFLGSSGYDVLNRLQGGAALDVMGGPSTNDVQNVLTLAYGGEMFPLRGAEGLTADACAAKYARGRPWGATAGGAAAYVGLAVLILKAYLFGIDSVQATWAPS